MAHLELWKLGADILLLGALGWLSFTIVRMRTVSGAPSRQGLELERTLRALLKEADLASSSLHDQLLRRQQSLERLLRDIEATEQRVTRAAANSESRVVSSPAPSRQPDLATNSNPRDFGTPEAPSFNTVANPNRPAAKTAAPAAPKTNIFGEPIREAAPRAPESVPLVRVPQTPLTSAIEREVVPSMEPPASPKNTAAAPAESLGEIRRAAEELLKAGRDLEFVARRTNLSLDEVRLISNAVLRDAANRNGKAAANVVERVESEEVPVAAADPRLGVLSPIRRTIETI